MSDDVTRDAAQPAITARTVGAFQENTYLVADPATGRAVLVDPGAEGEEIVAMVRRAGVALDAIWLTHAHIDHIGAIADVKRAWDVPIYLHPADRLVYEAGPKIADLYGLPFEMPPLPERELAEGDRLQVGELGFDVHHVPGHAPGHVVFVGAGVMLAGDLLFAGSVGRTDLPFCDPVAMQASLARIGDWPAESVVYPGHGAATTIQRELATNPFLNGIARVPAR